MEEPSIIRWWMRARLGVARAWQAANDRPYLYAGPRKGASWKQAARAELTQTSKHIEFANVMLDMVKAFERVPYQWLVAQGAECGYNIAILRLSIAAYRLARTITVDGVCSVLLVATRGITAGAVHATIELRVLIMHWMDQVVVEFPLATITVYVDDTSIESYGTMRTVEHSVVGAVRKFTTSMRSIGMEFNSSKSVCIASCSELARSLGRGLPNLGVRMARTAKSLGGALSNGKTRNATVARKRLAAFKVRKTQFQKLRRSIGARGCATVLRTGGTAALTYGQSTMGVSNTMLLAQRRAVAAASVASGAGELELTLVMADGSLKGRADPAFAAHEAPIGLWAEAVWERWLPRSATQKLVQQAQRTLANRTSPWAVVRGPAAAFVASAERLCWKVIDHVTVDTDRGHRLDLTRDSPAMVRCCIRDSVWRWRWRRLEANHPHLKQDEGGHGILVRPLFRLLSSSNQPEWGREQRGALRSAIMNRQWTQARLFRCGWTDTPNCKLCIAMGYCTPENRDHGFAGTLLHRVITCPALQQYRDRFAPPWIASMAGLRPQLHEHITTAEADLLTRALMPSLEPRIDRPPPDATFKWVKAPSRFASQVQGYVDGSRLYAEHELCGLVARQGWAIAAYDDNRQLVAAAHGRTPAWADGIHAAELWGLLMATQSFDPGCALKVDCLSVQQGSVRDIGWATAPGRKFPRAWA